MTDTRSRLLRAISALAGAFLLAGCMSMPADPSRMTPEQLRESAKDRGASVSCYSVGNAIWRVLAVLVQADRGTGATARAAEDCATVSVETTR